MTTGAAWTIDDPDIPKPWAWFDKDEIQDIPVDITDWLTDKGTTYASHSVETHASLECTNPTTGHTASVIKMRIQKLAAATLVDNTKYWVTLHLTGADGQKEDMTLYLKVRVK